MIEVFNAGADDYIRKSSDFEVLKARLRAQIRRKQFEDENRAIREQLLNKEIETTEARAAREVAEIRAALLGSWRRRTTSWPGRTWCSARARSGSGTSRIARPS